MSKAEFYAASYIIIEDNDSKILFGKRTNSGFRDGKFQIPAGHIEGKETMISCAIREAKEELDIDILNKDCRVVHISHRVSKDRVYFDVYVKIGKYFGKIKINEPEKCSELAFIDIDNISKDIKSLFSYDLEVLKKIRKGISFSEF